MHELQWYEIASLIVSFFTLCGFGVVMKNFWDDRHARKILNSEQHKEQIRKERQEAIRQVFKEEIDPITSDIRDIKRDLAKNTSGTITLLRDKMKEALDKGKMQGYVDSSDKANWHELYNTYKALGGNHFAEYVDQWKSEMDALPLETKSNKHN